MIKYNKITKQPKRDDTPNGNNCVSCNAPVIGRRGKVYCSETCKKRVCVDKARDKKESKEVKHKHGDEVALKGWAEKDGVRVGLGETRGITGTLDLSGLSDLNSTHIGIDATIDSSATNPSYYKQSSIECIDAIKAAVANKRPEEAVLVGNIIKYLWRYEEKDGAEALEKANWYLQNLINEHKNK